MIKLFISSTSRDLAAYRQKAIEICQRFDVHAIAMEYFEAMSAGATEGSLRKIDEADLYVGIFAHRYGYIEPGYEKAVTELELDRAIELALDRLCFLVDPTYPWPPEAIDYENHLKLEALKRRIERFHIRALFTSVDDFAVKFTQALVHWMHSKGHAAAQTRLSTPSQRVILAPPRPALLVGRETDLEKLKNRLQDSEKGSNLTILRGWPGVGKTTLITSLVYDDSLEPHFPDGVLWASVGQSPTLYGELKIWANVLGREDIGTSLQDAVKNLKPLLAKKRFLLIIDDVWQASDVGYFRELAGSQCALLVTTRADGVARAISNSADDVYYLDRLSDVQSVEFLQRLAPAVVAAYPHEAHDLMRDIEGLPLAIRVIGRLLADEDRLKGNVSQLILDLHTGSALLREQAPSDRFDRETGGIPSLSMLLSQSTERLVPELRLNFAKLGAFAPKPATFDLDAMRSIWRVDDPMPVVRTLVDRGLLEPLPSIARYQMHSLLVMHANELLNNEQALMSPAKTSVQKPPIEPIYPHINADTPEEYKGIYLKDLYGQLKLLERKRAKGGDVADEIEAVAAEITRLGGNLSSRMSY